MSQYIINTKNDSQSDALIKYLKSLDFIEVKVLKMPPKKSEAVADAKSFLEGLPNQKHSQSDVNKAIKSIRKKHGYQ
ncbi:MAG: hypothetical protein ACOVO2_08260 [Emticicia sp.]|uniref:hypothetical protein n=1 Tax=Emticicia sp. TaxID=1930953 RepID=UPI003BA5DCE4